MRTRRSLARFSMIFVWVFFLFIKPGGLICENSLVVKNADDFQADRTVLIHGWNWLRQDGRFAEWTWKPIDGDTAEACLNFEFLVTNKTNGGSGFSCKVKVIINSLKDNFVISGTVMLFNPFRPKYGENTKGVGYKAYRSFCASKLARTLKEGFKARIEWPPLGNRYHFAVAKEKVTLVYIKGTSRRETKREERNENRESGIKTERNLKNYE